MKKSKPRNDLTVDFLPVRTVNVQRGDAFSVGICTLVVVKVQKRTGNAMLLQADTGRRKRIAVDRLQRRYLRLGSDDARRAHRTLERTMLRLQRTAARDAQRPRA
jgi:hypothetical protein